MSNHHDDTTPTDVREILRDVEQQSHDAYQHEDGKPKPHHQPQPANGDLEPGQSEQERFNAEHHPGHHPKKLEPIAGDEGEG